MLNLRECTGRIPRQRMRVDGLTIGPDDFGPSAFSQNNLKQFILLKLA
ncbi:MAG: hypothetical protein AVDCRST_MAG93-6518 [uncultured Chloroflexia bacterium]|uniref:Uncharacterized protein n=1 Tax=uncultured Chloroflexia bacterium TaxID=1672391 RepID=A0A6J4LPK5_9CHLR|nr:MAG: hypothetical protein AVDCRST_MAG93-6518 [uncultured Chloroflexia bacterium]